MSLRSLVKLDGPLPVTAPLILNPLSETAGFAAIEIEDQLLPKRAHHHIGIEHMIPMELMTPRVREAVAARRNLDFLIIARTNAMRASNLDFGVRIVADTGTALLAGYAAWKQVYADLADDFGAGASQARLVGAGKRHAWRDRARKTPRDRARHG
jgi:hypothetical protein